MLTGVIPRFEAIGLREWWTGGNCRAMGYQRQDGLRIYVTDGDAHMPADTDHEAWVYVENEIGDIEDDPGTSFNSVDALVSRCRCFIDTGA
jgi:hypothetical protein